MDFCRAPLPHILMISIKPNHLPELFGFSLSFCVARVFDDLQAGSKAAQDTSMWAPNAAPGRLSEFGVLLLSIWRQEESCCCFNCLACFPKSFILKGMWEIVFEYSIFVGAGCRLAGFLQTIVVPCKTARDLRRSGVVCCMCWCHEVWRQELLPVAAPRSFHRLIRGL